MKKATRFNPTVLNLSGFDPYGAAGVLADTRAIESLGGHAKAIITANTVQNSDSFRQLNPVDSKNLIDQFENIKESISSIDVIKIGLLPTKEIVLETIKFLESNRKKLNWIVYDPVLNSSSNHSFFDSELLDLIKNQLCPFVDILTPNLREFNLLAETSVKTIEDSLPFLKLIHNKGPKLIYLKGGHSEDSKEKSVDIISTKNQGHYFLKSPIFKGAVRGTGCTLASSIATALAKGNPLNDAVVIAKTYTTNGIFQSFKGNSCRDDRIIPSLSWPKEIHRFPSLYCNNLDRKTLPLSPSMGERPIGVYPIVKDCQYLEEFCKLGITTIQLRIKDASRKQLEKEIEKAVAIANKYSLRLFINDYWELAIKYNAYGVHLGQEDLLDANIEKIKDNQLRLGISTHSFEEASIAHRYSPSYVALGPIYSTTCKSMEFGPRGLSLLQSWCQILPYPIVAIGGIKLPYMGWILGSGASGVSVISDIMEHTTPVNRASQWQQCFEDKKNLRQQ